MKYHKCILCEVLKAPVYTVTDIERDGLVTSYFMCSTCGQAYMKEVKERLYPKKDLQIIKTAEEFLEFLGMNEPTCKCGMTASEFDENGRFGCDECYKTFDLKEILIKSHGSDVHTGKVPKCLKKKKDMSSPSEIKKVLKLKLAKAIELENYEEAAKIKIELDAISL